MKRTSLLASLIASCLGVATLAIASSSQAQGFSTSASVSGYTSIKDGPQVHVDVTRNDSGTHTEASGSGNQSVVYPGITIGGTTTPPGLTLASVKGFAAADPGALHIYASDGVAAYGPGNGINPPRSDNFDHVSTSLSAAAAFTDTLTVTSATLAIGTAVGIPFDFGAEFLGAGFGRPQFSFHPITVTATVDLPGYAHQNYVTDAPFNVWQLIPTTDPAFGLYRVMTGDLMVQTHVGDTLDIAASFAVFADDFINQFSFLREDSVFADGRDTAGIWLGALPGDLALTSASGHDYRINPFDATATPPSDPGTGPAPLPEPSTGLLIGAGIGAAAWSARRRASPAPHSALMLASRINFA